MATNAAPTVAELTFEVSKDANHTVVQCAGRVVSETTASLKSTVKPLLSHGGTVVLDLTNVSYMDSSGLGTIVALYVSAKAARCQLKLTNLNKRVKELFSLTRLGQVMAEGRDPNDFGIA